MSMDIFEGILTALITPFNKGGIDIISLRHLIDRQIESGIKGLVIGGSTGEGSSLNTDEYSKLVKIASEYANNRINIIAGLTAVSSREAIAKLEKISSLKIDGLMCTAPHYIKPEQNGLSQHFKMIHDATNVPLMLYIHPGRTGCDFSDETIINIMQLERFVAVKDASSDLEKPLRILQKINVNMLTGNDSAMLSYYANGGAGCVSVIANIFPKLCIRIHALWKEGKINDSLMLQRKLVNLCTAVFAESNPIGIKYSAYKLGLCSKDILLPLTFAQEHTQNKINVELQQLAMLEKDVQYI
jgi:4-hydroxy-tetrahydrodipicolinate synthase